jgi:pilus assembly protein Flp/PilA
MKQLFSRFLTDESGAASIEYTLIGALIALAVIAGAIALGSALDGKFNSYATTVSGS